MVVIGRSLVRIESVNLASVSRNDVTINRHLINTLLLELSKFLVFLNTGRCGTTLEKQKHVSK